MNDFEFYVGLKAYFESMEQQMEAEYGVARNLEELLESDEMPALYQEVVRRLAIVEKELEKP